MRIRRLLPILSVLALPGCIVSDTVQEIHLEKDGSITWVVAQQDCHSDASEPAKRDEEEAAFLTSLRSEPPMAVAFGAIDGRDITMQILRDRAPFAVRTEARFASLPAAVERIAEATGVVMTTRSWAEGGIVHVSIEIPIDQDLEETGLDVVMPLAEEADELRFVLPRGAFVVAEGFALSDDGRVATLMEPEKVGNETRVARYVLAWRP